MKINYRFGKAGIVTVLLASLTGCTTYVVQRPESQRAYVPPPPQPAPVIVEQAPPPPPAPAVVVIQQEDDFVQPLSPYGDWVVVGSYGRCWRPARVETDWRPYANGHWELTADGWYWVSDEPWAWATYHYGRWQLASGYGWVWVPQTVWGPAWVSWRSGGGYVGWAPMPPEPRGGVSVSVTIAPATFCFVDERRMREPVRPTTVIVNNTTIINKTVIITKTKVVNKVVVNEGPRVDEVERVTGRKIQPVAVADLRKKEEEPVAEQHANLRARPDRVQQPQKQPEQKQVKQPVPQNNGRPPERPQNLQNQNQVKPAPEKVVRPQRENAKPGQLDSAAPSAPAKVQPTPPPAQVREQNTRQQQRQQNQEAQPAPKTARERAATPKQQNENNPRNARAADRSNRQNDGSDAKDNSGQAPK